MEQFKKGRLVPIEIVIVIAINLVVVVAGYYTVMMWGLFSG
jgi:flagellar basal body-associated protein FliL